MVQTALKQKGFPKEELVHHDHEEMDISRLTRNEQLVLTALKQAQGPLKAYELLTILKEHGVKAPMTIYRALDRLEDKGLIYKLDAMNAFVMCHHTNPHPLRIFLVCAECNRVEELEEESVSTLDWESLRQTAQASGFSAKTMHIEIRGSWADCP
ncbi:MAG: transcriptional repressor [Pseudomonadota bacterium]